MKLDVQRATLWAMSIRDCEHCYHCGGAAEYARPFSTPGVAAVRPDPREVAEWGWFPLDELPTPMAIGQADRIAAWHGKQLA